MLKFLPSILFFYMPIKYSSSAAYYFNVLYHLYHFAHENQQLNHAVINCTEL